MTRVLLILAVALAFAATPAVAQGALPPGPPVRMTVVSQPGPTLPQYVQVDIPLLREGVPRKSGGRVTVDLASWPERNINGPEAIRLVRSGVADVTAAPLVTVAGDVPFLDMVDLAGLNPTIEQARRVAEVVIPEANKALERFGVRIVAAYPFPAQVLFCREPVTRLADLRGRKVRTAGGSLNDLVAAAGGQPVGLGFPEVYAALERGVVDCAVTGTGSGNGARWFEVTRSIYALPLSWGVAGYYANVRWLDGLDPPVRRFVEGTFREVEAAQWDLGARATADGIACNTGEAGGCKLGRLVEVNPMTVVRPGSDDEALLRTYLKDAVLPAFVKRCGEACGRQFNALVAPIAGVRYEPR